MLARTLNEAVGVLMNNGKNPSRKVMEIDCRGSHFYLALYWAEALAKQDESEHLKIRFQSVAKQLK